MNFTTREFAVFLALSFAAYYAPLLRRFQLQVLVGASLYFYAYEFPYLLALLLISCAISAAMSRAVLLRGPREARPYLVFGVVLNLTILAFFKYKFLFFDPAAPAHASGSDSLLQGLLMLPLPIGISFYVFHGISLIVDSFRRDGDFFRHYDPRREPHGWNTVLYLTFFPQLISGPIVKARNFYPQIGRKRYGDIDWNLLSRYLITGFFLKLVVADNLQEQTYWMQYPYFQSQAGAQLLILLLGYSAQIFADFAGYSLIAIGLGLLFGYRLPENFNFPYIASSISDFWRRWHISLSSWLRDYLYIPLGGSRHGEARTYLNLIIVMFLGGLWHGAAWSFAVWGLWHGIGLALERPFLQRALFVSTHPAPVLARVIGTFVFVSFGWLLFKLQNFSEALLYLRSIATNLHQLPTITASFYVLAFSLPVLIYHLVHVLRQRLQWVPAPLAYGSLLALTVLSPGPSFQFVYFQF